MSLDDFSEAIAKAVLGATSKHGGAGPVPRDALRRVAIHEAGHAVMGALTPDYVLVTKVTIIPRTNGAGGFRV